MGKKKAIFFLFVFCFIIAIGFIGTIIYSIINISYQIDNTEVKTYIERTQLIPTPIYEGYLLVTTPVELNNGGFYAITDLMVGITVFAYNWEVSSNLNGEKIGQGHNVIGTLSGQNSWIGSIDLNITDYIFHLAVEDCTLRVIIDIHLIYKPIISIPFDYSPEAIEITYLAPFNSA